MSGFMSILMGVGYFIISINAHQGFWFSLLLLLVAGMTALIGSNVADIIKYTCKPELIFYHNTSQLISARVFWSFGINILGGIIGGVVGAKSIINFHVMGRILVIIAYIIISIIVFSILENIKKQTK